MELDRHLRYVDKKVDYTIKSFQRNSVWYIRKYGREEYVQKLQELKDSRKKTLLFEDDKGLWTYSGLTQFLANAFDDQVKVEFDYPKGKLIPWSSMPTGEDRYYQTESHDKLIDVHHGGVEIGTGLGKSRIIRNCTKTLGLKTVVMAPSESIAKQLYNDLVCHFGKKYVGFVGDGKKQYDRLFVVAIGASLRNLEPGSPGWEHLSRASVFIADESHLCPAETLVKVCFGVMANAPYRFFFSGTQMRNDGLDTLLYAITGEIVHRMSVREGVDQGFLAKPIFRMIRMNSDAKCKSDDANEQTRAHVYYNPKVVAAAADIANKAVSLMERPTLILVDEIEQFTKLLPHFRYEARFAHGGVSKDNKAKLPSQFHDSDPTKLVDEFNAGKFPILVGTSCVATGTDFQTVKCGIYLRGKKSEIEVKQGVGRITRLAPGKEDCLWVDFAIDNIETLNRHAKARKAIYDEIYPSYSEMRL